MKMKKKMKKRKQNTNTLPPTWPHLSIANKGSVGVQQVEVDDGAMSVAVPGVAAALVDDGDRSAIGVPHATQGVVGVAS